MRPPYHLYEFQLASFERHGARAGYRVAAHSVFPADTFLPKRAAAIATRVMDKTQTGMQLQVWLTKTAVG
jgi:hypothetical protein